ncbi:MAG: hypothetical protein U0802_14235 [Candidatus Binatia bacterium]
MVEPPQLIPEDLAPGDVRGLELDWAGLRVERVRSPAHPLFPRLYARLWEEFGPRGEMEKESVIAERLGWNPARPVEHHALRYELLAVLAGDQLVGMRDHTAIVPRPPHSRDHPAGGRPSLHVIVESRRCAAAACRPGCAPFRCRRRASAPPRPANWPATASPCRRDGAPPDAARRR